MTRAASKSDSQSVPHSIRHSRLDPAKPDLLWVGRSVPQMARITALAYFLFLSGCVMSPHDPIVFLTRDGCVNTVTMRANLDNALKSLGRSTEYAVIDAGVLPESDPRSGYGTPTVLVGNADMFGMPEPPVPAPPAT